MPQIAVVIIDPKEQRWAQLVDDQAPIHELLPVLARNLELPQRLNYELLDANEKTVLSGMGTLAAAGVLPGAELLLRPLRDAMLEELLDKLYDEAKGFVKAELLDMAKDRLVAILRLDPTFQDPANLRTTLEGAISAGKGAADAATLPGTAATKPAKQVVQEPAASKVAKTQARKGCSPGCAIASALAAGGAIMIGGIITVAVIGLPSLADLVSSLVGGGDIALGTGDVQVTLRWDTSADLDLHVTDPRGEEIFFDHQTSQSGGELDVDANANCGTQAYRPVENIYWPTGGAPRGTFSVSVIDFRNCDEVEPTSYEVIVRLDGRVYGTYTGEIIGEREEQFVVSFEW